MIRAVDKLKGQAMTQPTDEERRYARVLQFMHWAADQPESAGLTFAELLVIGCEHLRLPPPSPSLEAQLLRSAAKLAGVPFTKVMA